MPSTQLVRAAGPSQCPEAWNVSRTHDHAAASHDLVADVVALATLTWQRRLPVMHAHPVDETIKCSHMSKHVPVHSLPAAVLVDSKMQL